MTELPQATSRRELRERERAAEVPRSRPQTGRRDRPSRARAVEKARPVRSGKAPRATARPVERRGSRARTIGSRLLSFAAMIFAAAFVVGVSLPANAFFTPSTDTASSLSSSSSKAGQSVAVSGDEQVTVGTRDKVQVLSWAQVLAQKYNNGAKVGGAGTGPVRWPFPFAVRISSGFGPRAAPCNGCSTYHEGVDMVPGDKAAIFASSTGVVTTRDAGVNGSYNSTFGDRKSVV